MSPPDDPVTSAARTDAAPPLLRAVDGGVATLTMNRPRQFNAISVAMLEALQAELDAIGADPAIRVVVIAGAGGAFSGGHDLSTFAVADGKADVAFVASHRFMNTIGTGKVKLEDFNILWSSPLIPQDPFVYRGTLCPELKQKISDTFTTLDQTPEGKKFLENVDSEKFVTMKDSDYNIIRDAGVK